MITRVGLLVLFILAQVSTATVRLNYEPDLALAGAAIATAGAVLVGVFAARKGLPGEVWCSAAGTLNLWVLLKNHGASPEAPRVFTSVFGTPMHLLPALGALWTVGLTLLVARRLAAGSPGAKVYTAAWVLLGLLGLAAAAVELGDYATVLVPVLSLAIVLVAHLRRPVWAAGVVVAAGGFAAVAGEDLSGKIATRLTTTWWRSGPFAGPSDQVSRDLWGIAAGGTWGRGAGVVPADFTRWSDDSWVAFLVERHGVVGLLVALLAVCAAVVGTLKVSSRADSWCPEARALPIATLTLALVPTGWLVLAAYAVLPLMGVSSPMLFMGGTNAALAGLLVGLVIGTRRSRTDRGHAELAPVRLAGLAALTMLVGAAVGSLAVGMSARAGQFVAEPAVSCGTADNSAPREAHVLTNPRLTRLAERVGRADILDRHGLPLAVDLGGVRRTPFGDALGPVVGSHRDATGGEGWRAEHLSYPMRTVSSVCGEATTRDYSGLLPVLRGDWTVDEFRRRRGRVVATVDAQLSVGIATVLDRHLALPGAPPAAVAVVLGPDGTVRAEVTRFGEGAGAARATAARQMHEEIGDNFAERLVYEPGSTAKVPADLLAADRGKLPERPGCYLLPGHGPAGACGVEYGGVVTLMHDHPRSRPHGSSEELTLALALSKSCNCYHAFVGAELGAEAMTEWFTLLGWQRPTVADTAYGVTRAAIGQGVALTPRQLADSYLLLLGAPARAVPMFRIEGEALGKGTDLPRMGAPAREAVWRGLQGVVSTGGTGTAAHSELVEVVGKSGTADWAGPAGHRTVASFAGIVRASGEPYVLVVVMPDSNSAGGGAVAAPAFREIAELLAAQAAVREGA